MKREQQIRFENGWAIRGAYLAPLLNQLRDLPIGADCWIGYSLGGMRLLDELQRPSVGRSKMEDGRSQRPKALVLIASTLSFCQREAAPYGTPASQLRGIRAGLAKDPDKVLSTFATHCFAPAKVPDWPELMVNDVEQLTAGCNELIDVDFTGESFESVRGMPVLVLHGAEDAVISPEAAVALADALGTKPVFADGAGHALPITHAEWCAAAITAFVECVS